MAQSFRVILEFNCYHADSLAAVWLLPKMPEDLYQGSENLSDIPGAVRLVGPIASDAAAESFEQLCKFLKSMEISFDTDVIADD